MVDGLFIRSLLCSFFFELFPEIIEAGKLFIAEPPLYRIDDKNNPFVINKEDYNNRYIQKVMKEYKVGTYAFTTSSPDVRECVYFDKKQLKDFLEATTSYVDDILMLAKHYAVNDRLVELIIEEFANYCFTAKDEIQTMINKIDMNKLMIRVSEEFPELYYDEKDQIIKGVIDGKYQLLEISERLIRKSLPLISIMEQYGPFYGQQLVLRDIKTGTEQLLS